MESITEYLLNRIGETLGFKMARSKLGWFGGQLRFLSEYFITNPHEQVLDHGADLYAGYLNDKDFVEEIEEKDMSPDFFTVQFTEDTFENFYPIEKDILISEFLKLLIYDAYVGNNDRHFYYWVIIRNIKGTCSPVFSPIYDTARGLFWNDQEDKLKKMFNDISRRNLFIESYCEKSNPKTGWDLENKINHFRLVELIKSLPIYSTHISPFFNSLDSKLQLVCNLVDNEFMDLMSLERRELIKLWVTWQ